MMVQWHNDHEVSAHGIRMASAPFIWGGLKLV